MKQNKRRLMCILTMTLLCTMLFGITASAASRPRYIAHRGYTAEGTPENTMPAFEAAKEKGYSYVEADVQFTKDGVAVLCHNPIINFVARNTDGSEIQEIKLIATLTYEELLKYDFGIACGQEYAGTKILSFDQWIQFCSKNSVIPYIELKSYMTRGQVSSLMEMAREAGLADEAVWICETIYYNNLQKVVKENPEAEVGIVTSLVSKNVLTLAKKLKTENNRVFLDVNYLTLSAKIIKQALEAGIEVEAYTVNYARIANKLASYGVTGITTDCLLP